MTTAEMPISHRACTRMAASKISTLASPPMPGNSRVSRPKKYSTAAEMKKAMPSVSSR